jgi:hypothetical protein
MTSAPDYGVFTPLVAAVSVIIAAGGAIILLWAGPLEKWRPPDADLPGMAKRIIFLVCSVAMVLLALEASPQRLEWMKTTAWQLLVIAVVLGISYSVARHGLYHSRISARGDSRELVLGGLWMKRDAKVAMKENNLAVVDDLLDGAPGSAAIWSGSSRALSRIVVLGMFIAFVGSATTALMTAGLIVVVKTTGKPLF